MKNNMRKYVKIGSIAACLAIIFIAGAFLLNSDRMSNYEPSSDDNVVAGNGDTVSNEKYVDVIMLLASNKGLTELALIQKVMNVGEYSAVYDKVESVESRILKKSLGGEVEGAQNWYRVSGHEDMQYLILKDNNDYSLWIFDSFQNENYSYNDVLQMIYNIKSAEDIEIIIVLPANMDNTDAGIKLQNEIGTLAITDDGDIKSIYNVLTGLTCYGSDNWEKVGFGNTTLLYQVKAGRYLTLVTSQGMEIDTLKYTAISNVFYEYGGIAYSVLSEEEKTMIEKILGIE